MAATAQTSLPLSAFSRRYHYHSNTTTNDEKSSEAALATASSFFRISPPPNPTLKTPSIRTRLSTLCQEGQPHRARQLFDTIPHPPTSLWNTLIIGFICNRLPLHALLFYSRMKTSSPHPRTPCDPYTYSSALKACAKTRNLPLGKALHCHFLRCLSHPSWIVYNSLLNMYSACLSSTCSDQNYDLVHRVFDSMRKRNVIAWNTLVSWYVKNERYDEAVRHFRMMLRMGIRPSPVSFVNVFPAFSGIGDSDTAVVLYGMIVKLGSEFLNDLFVVSSAILMYAKLGPLDFARKVFNCCLHKNSEVWNTMIGGYVQNNCPFEALDLFLEAIEAKRAVVDEVTFLLALTAVSQTQCLDMAQQLHAFVIKNLATLPVIIMNSVIVMYCRCNSTDMAFKVFENMLERDVVSWNTMISSFVNNGLDDEGLMLVYEMQKQKFDIDSVTITTLLSAASNLGNAKIGKQTHAYLLRHGIQFEGMENYLIDMYAKSGLIWNAQHVFNKSCPKERDQATWNAMIAGYTQQGLIDEAFTTFSEMMVQNILPTAVTLASILPACNKWGSIHLGKQLHGVSVRCLLDQNIFVRSALVDMYSKTGSISYAERVFTNSQKNSVTYTSMIRGYGQHGMGDRALTLFWSMEKAGFKPDAVMFIAVLSACSYTGLVDEGLQIYKSMEREFKIEPSAQHICCVADMLGRAGRVVEACEFVNQLGDVGNFMEVWGSILGACKIHGYIELGKEIVKKLLRMEAADSLAGYQVLLSNMYAEEGNWKNVNYLRKEMRERGLHKEVGCSWINVGGHVSRFVSKDQDHPQSEDVYKILNALTMEMIET